jgi:hypothetical protein
LVGIPVAAAAALLFRPRAPDALTGLVDFALTVRIGAGHCTTAILQDALGNHLDRWRLTAMATARQGAALDVTYAVRLHRPQDASALVTELHAIEGVQSVELRRA